VADVGIGKAVRTGTATYNGEEALLGAALMLAGENSRLVAKPWTTSSRRFSPSFRRA
jgi:cobalt-zinc-cadmium resistance protein CzcA